ncbi:hypothetical protein [Nakamurella deserti]|uniref:hypothetical protein n=1 Tax=Nakamurella deserti TaxID=2164074 RepID=UPI001300B529|nr:hypothetical protein [Nakamurella deserti]
MSSAMEGGGRYNRHASAQAASARFGLDALAAAAGTAPRDPAGVVTVVDYGASEGRNSLLPMTTAVEAIRRRHGAAQPIRVLHTDLPDNDFSSLFRTVAADGGYRRPGVYSAAIGRSFYEQLVPDASVGLGWSAIAVHWLSGVPGPLDGFWFTTADAGQYATWAAAAAADWRAFLRARAAEMLPGARLVVVVGTAGGDGRGRRSGAERAMDEIGRGVDVLHDEGLLRDGDREAMVIPAWYRTADEWRAPFDDPEMDLDLEQLELVDIGDPLWDQTRSGGDYPTAVAAALRVSFGPALLQTLAADRRPLIAARLFDGHLARAIAEQPAEPWFHWRLAVLVVAKPR